MCSGEVTEESLMDCDEMDPANAGFATEYYSQGDAAHPIKIHFVQVKTFLISWIMLIYKVDCDYYEKEMNYYYLLRIVTTSTICVCIEF